MSKTLKLELETAKKLYKDASKEFKIMLEENFGKSAFLTKIEERCKTLKDVYNELGIETEDFLPFPEADNSFERKMNNIARLLKVEECYNKGWKPNWNNTTESKYYPYFRKTSGSWSVGFDYYCYCSYGSLAYFKSSNLALAAGNNFIDLYSDILESK